MQQEFKIFRDNSTRYSFFVVPTFDKLKYIGDCKPNFPTTLQYSLYISYLKLTIKNKGPHFLCGEISPYVNKNIDILYFALLAYCLLFTYALAYFTASCISRSESPGLPIAGVIEYVTPSSMDIML